MMYHQLKEILNNKTTSHIFFKNDVMRFLYGDILTYTTPALRLSSGEIIHQTHSTVSLASFDNNLTPTLHINALT